MKGGGGFSARTVEVDDSDDSEDMTPIRPRLEIMPGSPTTSGISTLSPSCGLWPSGGSLWLRDRMDVHNHGLERVEKGDSVFVSLE